MAHFEDVGAEISAAMRKQSSFCFRLGIASKEHSNSAKRHAHDDRIVVDVGGRSSDQRQLRCEYGDMGSRTKIECGPALCTNPANVTLAHYLKCTVIRRSIVQLR